MSALLCIVCVCCHPIYSGRHVCGRTSRGQWKATALKAEVWVKTVTAGGRRFMAAWRKDATRHRQEKREATRLGNLLSHIPIDLVDEPKKPLYGREETDRDLRSACSCVA